MPPLAAMAGVAEVHAMTLFNRNIEGNSPSGFDSRQTASPSSNSRSFFVSPGQHHHQSPETKKGKTEGKRKGRPRKRKLPASDVPPDVTEWGRCFIPEEGGADASSSVLLMDPSSSSREHLHSNSTSNVSHDSTGGLTGQTPCKSFYF